MWRQLSSNFPIKQPQNISILLVLTSPLLSFHSVSKHFTAWIMFYLGESAKLPLQPTRYFGNIIFTICTIHRTNISVYSNISYSLTPIRDLIDRVKTPQWATVCTSSLRYFFQLSLVLPNMACQIGCQNEWQSDGSVPVYLRLGLHM